MKRVLYRCISALLTIIVHTRHYLYNKGIFTSYTFSQIPIVVIGNLKLGGTGKSPFTIYLAKKLAEKYSLMVLSRGYGRKSKGWQEVLVNSTSEQVGDEPLMIKNNVQNAQVVVCEDRVFAIRSRIKQNIPNSLIILDDALQHRRLNAPINILLTEFDKLFYNDYLFPLGSLRDVKNKAAQVQIVLITKCDKNISKESKNSIERELKSYTNAEIYFSYIQYQAPISILTNDSIQVKKGTKSIVVSGIANSAQFISHLTDIVNIVKHFKYSDHKKFTFEDIIMHINFCQKNDIQLILITEKDSVKLKRYREDYLKHNIEVVYIPIEMSIIEKELDFLQSIEEKIKQIKP